MNIFKKISIIFCFSILLFSPLLAFGQGGNITPSAPSKEREITVSIRNPFNCGDATGRTEECTIMSLITAILDNIIMPIVAVGLVFWIIYSGFMFVKSQGNPGELKAARNRLQWALIGGGVLLGASAIAKVVENTVKSIINTQ